MSSDPAIRVENLSKQYRIGGPQARYDTFRQSLTDIFSSPFRRAYRLLRGNPGGAADLTQTIWALQGISFSVRQGEVIGIIGPNGAGKSTLLKILARITSPTEGGAEICGRLGSLLEVGTGFHGELTGRENIYLNGAILGMKKSEIEEKMDAIIAFSGVEKFVDTPVKFYSTGMELRLAFSVAAHLEPEVLLVDEVLAVGDAAFQKKCLKKIDGISRAGRTVILVSHNMAAISKLCSKTIWLSDGQLRLFDDTDLVVRQYLSNVPSNETGRDIRSRTDRRGRGPARLAGATILDHDGNSTTSFPSGSTVNIQLKYESETADDLPDTIFTIRVYDQLQQLVFSLGNHLTGQPFLGLPQTGVVRAEVPSILLVPGAYSASVLIHCGGHVSDHVEEVANFTVADSSFLGGTIPMRPHVYGSVTMPHTWNQVS